jgi:Uma2 family endonuclease
MTTSAPRRVSVRYDVPVVRDEWTLPEEPMPESQPHDLALDLLKALLLAWVGRLQLDAQVARNLAVRWDAARPKVGVDPDLCVIRPRTPEGDELTSLCLWKPGHHAPRLAIEVVSESNPRKDYVTAPDRYAASGARELWIFDPKLSGPTSHGGPHRLQIWGRDEENAFRQLYAGEGPFYSAAVEGWLFPVDEGRRLRIANDQAGTRWWLTAEEAGRAEAERARAEAERAQAEAARAQAEKERALRRVDELERELEALRRG